jgi:two-component system alkaline phosphatase synthesis response regulator PhoP
MKKTVLIVDDEPCIQETTRYILEAEGFQVLSARNGVEGLALLRQAHPRAVLLDVMMPGLNGFEVCREIRGDPSLQGIFVAFLTAKGQKADEALARRAGADAFMCKPFDDDELVARLKAVFAERADAGSESDRPLGDLG